MQSPHGAATKGRPPRLFAFVRCLQVLWIVTSFFEPTKMGHGASCLLNSVRDAAKVACRAFGSMQCDHRTKERKANKGRMIASYARRDTTRVLLFFCIFYGPRTLKGGGQKKVITKVKETYQKCLQPAVFSAWEVQTVDMS